MQAADGKPPHRPPPAGGGGVAGGLLEVDGPLEVEVGGAVLTVLDVVAGAETDVLVGPAGSTGSGAGTAVPGCLHPARTEHPHRTAAAMRSAVEDLTRAQTFRPDARQHGTLAWSDVYNKLVYPH